MKYNAQTLISTRSYYGGDYGQLQEGDNDCYQWNCGGRHHSMLECPLTKEKWLSQFKLDVHIRNAAPLFENKIGG